MYSLLLPGRVQDFACIGILKVRHKVSRILSVFVYLAVVDALIVVADPFLISVFTGVTILIAITV